MSVPSPRKHPSQKHHHQQRSMPQPSRQRSMVRLLSCVAPLLLVLFQLLDFRGKHYLGNLIVVQQGTVTGNNVELEKDHAKDVNMSATTVASTLITGPLGRNYSPEILQQPDHEATNIIASAASPTRVNHHLLLGNNISHSHNSGIPGTTRTYNSNSNNKNANIQNSNNTNSNIGGANNNTTSEPSIDAKNVVFNNNLAGDARPRHAHSNANPGFVGRTTTNRTAGNKKDDSIVCEQSGRFKHECCAGWDVNLDSWWLHRPTWEVSLENETAQCFRRIQNADKRRFFQKLYDNQWKGNCSQAITSTQISSGYSAATHWLAYVFLKALQEGKPFQIDRHDFPWLYGPRNTSSWAYCASQDITCYYLPVSHCERKFTPQGRLRKIVKEERLSVVPERGRQNQLEFLWLKDFMMRPTQIMRRKLFELRQSIHLTLPCLAMHVRRGDVAFPQQPFRRYAAVQEYLDAADAQEGDNILLMTDDQTTIDEIHQHHPQYNWMYIKRHRNRGVEGGWESHVPSGDGPFEMLVVNTETYLATQCNKVVHGNSGFMQVVRGRMDIEGKKYKNYFVNTGVSKEEAKKWPGDGKERAEHYFMKEMDEYRRNSLAAKKKRGLNNKW